jgi:hypothetical protein
VSMTVHGFRTIEISDSTKLYPDGPEMIAVKSEELDQSSMLVGLGYQPFVRPVPFISLRCYDGTLPIERVWNCLTKGCNVNKEDDTSAVGWKCEQPEPPSGNAPELPPLYSNGPNY